MEHRKPEIGDWVHYIPRPGQVRANQSKLAALVVMINADGSLELEVHAWNSEPVWQSKVREECETIAAHCWRFKSVIVQNGAGKFFAVDAKDVSQQTSDAQVTASKHQWTPDELAAYGNTGKPPIVRNVAKKAAPAG